MLAGSENLVVAFTIFVHATDCKVSNSGFVSDVKAIDGFRRGDNAHNLKSMPISVLDI